jgi:quercetin dioxygenase-like cupin family protein
MSEQTYFEQSGEPSDAPGRFVHVDDLHPLHAVAGITFRPVTTETVMTNFVTLEPDAHLPAHHHAEQQITIVQSGELTLTVGAETREMAAGDCVVVPSQVLHSGVAGPQGCMVVDVFTPPSATISRLMSS